MPQFLMEIMNQNWKSTSGMMGRHPRGGGGNYEKNLLGVCSRLPKTFTLFMTKICDFQYAIYDLTLNQYPVSDLPYAYNCGQCPWDTYVI